MIDIFTANPTSEIGQELIQENTIAIGKKPNKQKQPIEQEDRMYLGSISGEDERLRWKCRIDIVSSNRYIYVDTMKIDIEQGLRLINLLLEATVKLIKT